MSHFITHAIQSAMFEAFSFLGPEAAAVLSGFGVLVLDRLYLTEAGERYVAAYEGEG